MHIVTDSGMDLPPEQIAALNIHIVPHKITIAGKTYLSNIELSPNDLFRLLEETSEMPVTSAPSAGDFAELYRRLAQDDPNILSIHMSSGLSAPANVATAAKQMAPEANVTVVDTKTLSAVLGWQVMAAVHAARAGWDTSRIITMIQQINSVSESIYTIDDLTYLIHGGRIGHMKGLIASVLHLRPLIRVEKEGGTYQQAGMSRTVKGALTGLIKYVREHHPPGSRLRTQLGHGYTPKAIALLRERMDALYDCVWMPTTQLTTMMSAHTGPTMVGIAFAAEDDLPPFFKELPIEAKGGGR